MQNIPSHATDIRHIFRATPSHPEIRNCASSGSDVVVSLPQIYNVTTRRGRLPVSELIVSDEVQLLHNDEPMWLSLKHLEPGTSSNNYTCTLTFESSITKGDDAI